MKHWIFRKLISRRLNELVDLVNKGYQLTKNQYSELNALSTLEGIYAKLSK